MHKSLPPRPQILGILNITADSFSDGGKYLTPEAAIAKARSLIAEGADILDIGPAPSNPDAAPVAPETELARLKPVLDALGKEVPISVDSFQIATQRYAMSRHVAYLNDIQGFPDAEIYPELAASNARLILMHSVQGRGLADRRPAPEGDIVAHICRFFEARLKALEDAGISSDRIVLDPGMGFFLGDAPETSFSVLARLGEIKGRFDLPVLISVSRKSFLRKVTGRAPGEAGAASQAAELLAALAGAEFIRTHEPAPLKDALSVLAAFQAQKQ
ncbi:MAG: dihydropteroate synthase [Rhizobiales bacterium]|nr:dihydropteroate synthase [Hyphomicrobiales bacterium]